MWGDGSRVGQKREEQRVLILFFFSEVNSIYSYLGSLGTLKLAPTPPPPTFEVLNVVGEDASLTPTLIMIDSSIAHLGWVTSGWSRANLTSLRVIVVARNLSV